MNKNQVPINYDKFHEQFKSIMKNYEFKKNIPKNYFNYSGFQFRDGLLKSIILEKLYYSAILSIKDKSKIVNLFKYENAHKVRADLLVCKDTYFIYKLLQYNLISENVFYCDNINRIFDYYNKKYIYKDFQYLMNKLDNNGYIVVNESYKHLFKLINYCIEHNKGIYILCCTSSKNRLKLLKIFKKHESVFKKGVAFFPYAFLNCDLPHFISLVVNKDNIKIIKYWVEYDTNRSIDNFKYGLTYHDLKNLKIYLKLFSGYPKYYLAIKEEIKKRVQK